MDHLCITNDELDIITMLFNHNSFPLKTHDLMCAVFFEFYDIGFIIWYYEKLHLLCYTQWKLITMNNEKFEQAVLKLNEKYNGKMKIILGVSQISKPKLCKPSSEQHYIRYNDCQILIYNQNNLESNNQDT